MATYPSSFNEAHARIGKWGDLVDMRHRSSFGKPNSGISSLPLSGISCQTVTAANSKIRSSIHQTYRLCQGFALRQPPPVLQCIPVLAHGFLGSVVFWRMAHNSLMPTVKDDLSKKGTDIVG